MFTSLVQVLETSDSPHSAHANPYIHSMRSSNGESHSLDRINKTQHPIGILPAKCSDIQAPNPIVHIARSHRAIEPCVHFNNEWSLPFLWVAPIPITCAHQFFIIMYIYIIHISLCIAYTTASAFIQHPIIRLFFPRRHFFFAMAMLSSAIAFYVYCIQHILHQYARRVYTI